MKFSDFFSSKKEAPVAPEPPAAPVSEWKYCPEGWDSSDPKLSGWDEESAVRPFLTGWPNYQELMSGTAPLGFLSPAAVQQGNASDHQPTLWAQNVVLMFAYSLALAAQNKSRLALLDYGGALGYYRLVAEKSLPTVQLDYFCKDMPAFCREGRQLFPETVFFENDGEALDGKSYDLIVTLGSLQYVKDWRQLIQRFAESSKDYLLIGRLPVVNQAPSFVVAQHPTQLGFVQKQHQWFLNSGELVATCEEMGFSLQREFLGAENHEVPGAPEQPKFNGFLFRKRP
jgi:putative methyltransferase (TIGR04325 family)